MECLEKNPEFLEFVASIKEEFVFLIFGGGGSTGSGCAPMRLIEIVKEVNLT